VFPGLAKLNWLQS